MTEDDVRRLPRAHRGQRRPALGVRHRLRRSAGRRRHDRARRASTRRPCGVLPDARRRRAGLSPPAAASGSPAPPNSRRRSRSPTSRSTCSARPACCCAAAPAGPTGTGPSDEDALRLLPRRARVPQRRAWSSGSNGDFAAARRPAAGRSSTWRLALLRRAAHVGDPVLAAIAAKGVKELTYHRDYAAQWVVRLGDGTDESHRRMQAGAGRDLAAASTSCSSRTRSRPRSPGVAADGRDLRAEVDVVLDTVLAARRAGRPDRAPWPRCAGGPDETACTPRRSADCSPRCRAWPARTRTRRGDRRIAEPMRRGTPRRDGIAAVPDPELPMLTLADLGVLRDVRPRTARRSSRSRPTYSGCPAMRDDARRPAHRAAAGRVRRRRGAHRAVARLDARDWITDDGRRKLAAAGIAPPGPAPRSATGPVPLHLGCRAGRAVACPRCGSADTDEPRAVRRDRLQGAAPLPGLPRAVRARQGDLSGGPHRRRRRSTR